MVSSLIRTAFLIEPVKTPAIETTKFEVRWGVRVETDDPRRAPFETCVSIFVCLMEGARRAVPGSRERRMLDLFLESPRPIAYEIPVDYGERTTNTPIHVPENLVWLWDDQNVLSAVQLRKAVTDTELTGDEAATFRRAFDSKIGVKAYLTDRALTGVYKTNREKRWEVHPGSVQFAKRAACMSVEREVMEQLCYFQGFPEHVRSRLVKAHVITPDRQVTRCPITLDPLCYAEISSELVNRTHGKSTFHVGHKNPLKAITEDPNVGHAAENIAWISENGNRIQGSLTLAEVRTLLRRIVTNHAEAGNPLED